VVQATRPEPVGAGSGLRRRRGTAFVGPARRSPICRPYGGERQPSGIRSVRARPWAPSLSSPVARWSPEASSSSRCGRTNESIGRNPGARRRLDRGHGTLLMHSFTTRTSMRISNLATVILGDGSGLQDRDPAVQCANRSLCESSGGGECMAKSTGTMWCAYQSADCESGHRWSPEAGDGLANTARRPRRR